MNISEVLKNTSYDTSMFSDSAIKAIEDNGTIHITKALRN